MTQTTPNAPYSGGETHQITDDAHPVLTTNHGTPIADNQNQLKAGARGVEGAHDAVDLRGPGVGDDGDLHGLSSVRAEQALSLSKPRLEAR